MTDIESQIVAKARELVEAWKDVAYTRKPEDKQRITAIQYDLMKLCEEKTNG